MALGLGIVFEPIATLLVLAVLHNLTPVAFLAERLRGEDRERALVASVLVFALVPLAIALGLPTYVVANAGFWAPGWSLLEAGPLGRYVETYVPQAWAQRPWAIDLFAAFAYLQCMHYAVVLLVLPRLADPDWSGWSGARLVLRWPKRSVFRVLLVGSAGVALVAFAVSFGEAREIYGLAAAVHAWVELPLLLLALAFWGAARTNPRLGGIG